MHTALLSSTLLTLGQSQQPGMIWLYAGFVALVLVFLALDLGVFHRHAHIVSVKVPDLRCQIPPARYLVCQDMRWLGMRWLGMRWRGIGSRTCQRMALAWRC